MTEFIYVLTITTGVDDYKPRGEIATSCVTLYKTSEDANNYIKKYIMEYIVEYFDRETIKDSKYSYLFGLSDEDDSDSDGSIDDYMFSGLYEEFCKGEFIPYKWTYSIEKCDNPHNQ